MQHGVTSMSYCKDCRARFLFLETKNRKAIPVDFDSVAEKDRRRALGGVPIEYDPAAGHVSHFSTCPAKQRNGKGA